MINDIRFQASKLLELSGNTQLQGAKDQFQEIYENAFEDVFQVNTAKNSEDSNKTQMPLGIPANFLYEFSMMEDNFGENLE